MHELKQTTALQNQANNLREEVTTLRNELNGLGEGVERLKKEEAHTRSNVLGVKEEVVTWQKEVGLRQREVGVLRDHVLQLVEVKGKVQTLDLNTTSLLQKSPMKKTMFCKRDH